MSCVAEMLAVTGKMEPDRLIPLLQEVQAREGYVSRESMNTLAVALDVPVSRVYGVATFYNQFRFAPLGEHVIEICRGTACHVKESLALMRHLKRRLKLREDGNSSDGRFSVISVACLGACSIAPVIKIDGEFYGNLTIEKLDVLLDGITCNKTVHGGRREEQAPRAGLRPAEGRLEEDTLEVGRLVEEAGKR
jgi:NADH-quinone oxidoreductase subunit E